MKITLPGLGDGAIASSEEGRQYRVRNHIAHIKPLDFEGLGLNEYRFTRFDAHPFDPNAKIRRDFDVIILANDTAAVYDDDPTDVGDFSHPDDVAGVPQVATAAGVLTARDIISAVGTMSVDERMRFMAAMTAGLSGPGDADSTPTTQGAESAEQQPARRSHRSHSAAE